MAEREEEQTKKTIQSKLEDVERRIQSLESKSPHVVIHGNVGFLGSVGGQNIENVQNKRLESTFNTEGKREGRKIPVEEEVEEEDDLTGERRLEVSGEPDCHLLCFSGAQTEPGAGGGPAEEGQGGGGGDLEAGPGAQSQGERRRKRRKGARDCVGQ